MSQFTMPQISFSQVKLLARDALTRANWNASISKSSGKQNAFDNVLTEEYEAWVNYSRSMYPNEPSDFMLGCETHHGACLPYFERGDRWEHDGFGWTMVKSNGQQILLRDPKEGT